MSLPEQFNRAQLTFALHRSKELQLLVSDWTYEVTHLCFNHYCISGHHTIVEQFGQYIEAQKAGKTTRPAGL